MAARDILDKTRGNFVDLSTAPTRSIVYTVTFTGVDIPLNAFVGAGQFNKEEREKLSDVQMFSALKLPTPPNTDVNGDTITYDGVIYKVKRYTKQGQLYNVVGEISRHRGSPRR